MRHSLFALALVCFSFPALAQEVAKPGYIIEQSFLPRPNDGEPRRVTLLVEQATGRTWMLVNDGKSPRWLPVDFSTAGKSNLPPAQPAQ